MCTEATISHVKQSGMSSTEMCSKQLVPLPLIMSKITFVLNTGHAKSKSNMLSKMHLLIPFNWVLLVTKMGKKSIKMYLTRKNVNKEGRIFG